MEFKIGDKVKYIGFHKYIWGLDGVVVAKCRVLSKLCRIVKFTKGDTHHVLTKYLVLNNKNQQLLFNFME